MLSVIMALSIAAYPSGPLMTNCYLLVDDSTREAAIVDIGGNNPTLIQAIKKQNLTLKYILATHGHFDHIFGIGYLQEAFPEVKSYCHKLDSQMWTEAAKFAEMFGIATPKNLPEEPDVLFDSTMTFTLGSHTFRILETPGHTEGSVCFISDDDKVVLTGDTLFDGSIGRTDFPGSSPQQMHDSILLLDREVPKDYTIYPGHDSYGVSIESAVKSAKKMI